MSGGGGEGKERGRRGEEGEEEDGMVRFKPELLKSAFKSTVLEKGNLTL